MNDFQIEGDIGDDIRRVQRFPVAPIELVKQVIRQQILLQALLRLQVTMLVYITLQSAL